mgnify:CR=1 FL=1
MTSTDAASPKLSTYDPKDPVGWVRLVKHLGSAFGWTPFLGPRAQRVAAAGNGGAIVWPHATAAAYIATLPAGERKAATDEHRKVLRALVGALTPKLIDLLAASLDDAGELYTQLCVHLIPDIGTAQTDAEEALQQPPKPAEDQKLAWSLYLVAAEQALTDARAAGTNDATAVKLLLRGLEGIPAIHAVAQNALLLAPEGNKATTVLAKLKALGKTEAQKLVLESAIGATAKVWGVG